MIEADIQPSSFIAHFIGHEGRGSLLSYLKGKGWVNSLRAGSFHPAAGFDAFKITMDLTPEGLGMSPVRPCVQNPQLTLQNTTKM
jgi:secreted Zn-dependent insulinase-like peptidase